MKVNRDRLEESLVHLRELAPSRIETNEIVQEVVSAAHRLFGLSGSALMVVDAGRALRSVASTDSHGELLERTQLEVGEGPCIECFVYDRPVPTTDLHSDERYPRLAKLLAGKDIHGLLGVPVRLGDGPVGSLNVYVTEPHDWTGEEVTALEDYSRILSALLSAALAAERNDALAQQLQYALDYRIVIERGVGYLMARDGTDAVAAFNLLRNAARKSRRRVGDIASDLLAGHSIP